MRKTTVALLAAAGICLAAPAIPNAAAASTGFFGLSTSPPFDGRDIPKMRSTGVQTVRVPIVWANLQPKRNSLRWGGTERAIGDLAARGIRVVPFVYGTPPWLANELKRPPLGSATKENAWRRFLTRLVERYGPGGSYWDGDYERHHPGARPVPITAWQVWNEPNLRAFFLPQTKASPRRYAKLVRISHNAISAVDPGARIVLAGMVGYADPTAWAFLKKFYAVNGIKQYFDVAAVHPYSATIEQFRAILGNVHHVLGARHDGTTPLWITEVGWGSAHHTNREPLNKGPQGQKRMLRRSFNLVLDNRRRWHVGRLFWFDWRDPVRGGHGGCNFCDSSGLLRHNHRTKPSYRAFRSFALSN
jgi:hypothetical protein